MRGDLAASATIDWGYPFRSDKTIDSPQQEEKEVFE